jgi:LemA protein
VNWAVLIPIVVIVVVLALIAFYLWASYSSLVTLKQRVDEAWTDITNQMRQRADVLPALTDTVLHHATHEQKAVGALGRARDETVGAGTPGDATVAENHFQGALRNVYAIAEGYPALHASPQYLQLQSDIAESQERIQASRRFYNGGVREFNAKIQTFPYRMFARRLGFSRRDFFEVSDSASVAEPPRVQF